MKTTGRVMLRSLAATPLRLAIVYAGMMVLFSIDFRPFPDWTADAIGYAIQFASSYLLAFWVLHLRSTRWTDGLIVAFSFIVVGTVLELFLSAALRGPSLAVFVNAFSWQSGLLYLVYLLGVMVATWQVRRWIKHAPAQV